MAKKILTVREIRDAYYTLNQGIGPDSGITVGTLHSMDLAMTEAQLSGHARGLENSVKPTKEYKEYQEKLQALQRDHMVVNDKGLPLTMNGVPLYDKIYNAAITELRAQYAAEIEAQEARIADAEATLDTTREVEVIEVPVSALKGDCAAMLPVILKLRPILIRDSDPASVKA